MNKTKHRLLTRMVPPKTLDIRIDVDRSTAAGRLPKPAEDDAIGRPDEAPLYTHETRAVCPRCGSANAASHGTLYNGAVKRWECQSPVCRHKWQTAGRRIR